MTELKTTNPITVTVTGAGGFSGKVDLAASVTDSSNAPIAGWTVELSQASVTLPENGTAMVVATVKLPALNTDLTGTAKFTGTSAATTGTKIVESTVTALNQVTFALAVNNTTGACEYPADAGNQANPVALALGTTVRFFNTGTQNLVIHSGGIISHQGAPPNGTADPVTEPNTAYEQLPTGTGSAVWYCHTPATDLGASDPEFTVQYAQ